MSANIVTVDEESLRKDIKNLVRKTVEETLNALLDEEASELVGAGRYERTAGREAYRSGHYARKLVTGAGEVELNVPKLRGATFQTAVIERYRRRETSVEEAIVEMYLAGVSTRRIEDVSELLWGAPVSSGTVSNLNEKAFASIEAWRQRPLEGDYPYVFVDGIYLKRSWGGSYETWPFWWPSASTPPATGRSSAARRATPSRRTRGASSSRGSGGAGSPACGSSPATSARGCSVRSRRCSPGHATSAARSTSTETCWEGCP